MDLKSARRNRFELNRGGETQVLDTIDQLKQLVPPPADRVNTGSLEEWETLQQEIGLLLPRELYATSATYGSGAFVDGGFALELHSAFRPGYPQLVEWNRRIFEQEERTGASLYKGMFEIGCYSIDDDALNGRLFWTIDDALPQWELGVTRPLTRFELSLTEFLIEIFSNRIQIEGFPSQFTSVRFEPWARTEPGS